MKDLATDRNTWKKLTQAKEMRVSRSNKRQDQVIQRMARANGFRWIGLSTIK